MIKRIINLLAIIYVGSVVGVILGASILAAVTLSPDEIASHLAGAPEPVVAAVASPVEEVPEPEPEPAAIEEPGEVYTITGYCPCVACCGKWSAAHPSRQGTDYVQRTASGTVPTEGRTAGADWATLPAGTVVEIEGLGQRTIEDTGAQWVFDRYEGKLIDLFFDTHEAAREWGKQKLTVKVVAE